MMDESELRQDFTAIRMVSLTIIANELGDRANGLRLQAEVTMRRFGPAGV
jgi:hypothetical protein